MIHAIAAKAWWELHLRKARGEALSDSEQTLYESELARQDREASPLSCDMDTLKQLRVQAGKLERTNADLRSRLTMLEKEIEAVEKSLSDEARTALGVQG